MNDHGIYNHVFFADNARCQHEAEPSMLNCTVEYIGRYRPSFRCLPDTNSLETEQCKQSFDGRNFGIYCFNVTAYHTGDNVFCYFNFTESTPVELSHSVSLYSEIKR